MNDIKAKIDSIDSFDEFTEILQSKEFLSRVSEVLTLYNIKGKAKLFLSAYTINKFPRDTIGHLGELNMEGFEIYRTEEDEHLINAANLIVNECNNICDKEDVVGGENLNKYIDKFIELFNKWKSTDVSELKDAILKEYHNLTVSIMNAPEVSRESLEACKENLLETAKKIGGEDFVNYILEHSPVVIDIEELTKQYSKAFWDLLKEEYGQKKYDKIYVVLEHIINLFSQIKSDEEMAVIKERVDVEFIKQRLDHDAYSVEEMWNLCNYIVNICKEVQAPEFDQNSNILLNNITEDGFLPIFLNEIVIILDITVKDTLKLREINDKLKEK